MTTDALRKLDNTPGPLKAELIDSAEIQQPRTAKGFDCWIMLRGTTAASIYIPAKTHRALNRTVALLAAIVRFCGFPPFGLPEHHLLSLRMG